MALLSIGHSNLDEPAFFALLGKAGVTGIVDVRSFPSSRRYPHFSREKLSATCPAHGLTYEFRGETLGGRPSDPALVRGGAADYVAMAASPVFVAAVARLVKEAGQGRRALMCSEREPRECHRCLLVGRALLARGVDVEHVKGDGKIERQSEIEDGFSTGVDLFKSRDEAIAEGYAKLAGKHAWRSEPSPANGKS